MSDLDQENVNIFELTSFEHNPSTSDFPTKKRRISSVTESFVNLLRDELKSDQWKLIVGTVLHPVTPELDFETAFKLSIDGGLINPDLEELCKILNSVKKQDLAEKIQEYSSAFSGMAKDEFHSKLIEEIETEFIEEHEKWSSHLRDYTKEQNKKVNIIFDDEENVLLESVFTNLTVLRDVEAIKISEVDSLNEIAYLRAITQEEKSLETIDFLNIITTKEPDEPEILCLTGNSGCGKTFLCKYIALLYGTRELTNFRYVLSIQCNNEEWHTMEKEREEKDEKVDSHFLRKFLLLGTHFIDKWIESLSKYLVKANGEGLLLILDGIDEFTKCVPFKSTLLFSLLQKSILTRATILITSRPGQWENLKEEHAEQLKIDWNFQVLGFSPSDRDTYFTKRISTKDKLSDTKQLFFLYDEVNQLSLIPVNASLFTSLFNATNKILSQTLTDLYSKLIVYIIRRQLSRIGLKKFTRVDHISQFNQLILNCINTIGEEAYEGIFNRELSSREEDISIRIDEHQYRTERLGLMELNVKILKLGQRVKVWTFAHLTLQEYMAAVYLSNKGWVTICLIIRFIVSSEEMFIIYKMVVRFLCGILGDKAACLIPIICRNLTPETMPLINLPISQQLCYDCGLVSVSGWVEFTKFFLLQVTIIVETKSQQIEEYFKCFKILLPEHLHLYFKNNVSPNEWHCFVLSLSYIKKLKFLYITTSLINPAQFNNLLSQLSSCSLTHFALSFSKQNYEKIQSYTNLLSSTSVSYSYKLSIILHSCDLLETQPSKPLFTAHNQFTGSLLLYESRISNEILEHLTNQFSLFENIFYAPKLGASEWSILKRLISNNSQIKSLCINDPNSLLSLTPDILTGLTSLEELFWHTEDAYSTLPFLSSNNLRYLSLFSPNESTPIENAIRQLNGLIDHNKTSLQSIELYDLDTIGFNTWTSILTPIQSCCKLVFLSFSHVPFASDDISYWNTAIRYMQSLISLSIIAIPLQDSGLMILCKSLNRHPAIRNLRIVSCSISYLSCEPIQMLIHTLLYIKELTLNKNELTFLNPDPLQDLERTADHFLVNVKFEE